MNLRNIFAKKELVEVLPNLDSIPIPCDEWVEIAVEKPPHEVVLAACDTHDCGWVMDTVWWYDEKQIWMTTGGIKDNPAHLPYTHWRKLPSYPNVVVI